MQVNRITFHVTQTGEVGIYTQDLFMGTFSGQQMAEQINRGQTMKWSNYENVFPDNMHYILRICNLQSVRSRQ